MAYTTIEFERKKGVGLVTLNRPSVGNTIDLQMALDLKELLCQIQKDDDLKIVVIEGKECFCRGEDPKESQGGSIGDFLSNCDLAQALVGVDMPVIAAIEGDAMGIGLALALACDIRIASTTAQFSVATPNQDQLLPTGITQLLPRIVGRGKALEMLLLANTLNADEALQIGLVHRLVPPGDVVNNAIELAEKMASKSIISLKYAKETVCKGLDLTLDQGMRLECDMYMIMHTTHDRTEGIRAFLEKRPPNFSGA
ncbi:MAG: enoyl-CoA hydratase/isomerase family protein [Chloroflexota bacterium]|nr:enoyl-CoA hydratase/isomerase family protein [Chloroflexota bacterium]